MFGWWKKNDGFEWREYVRTTILLRRKQRKDRIKQAQAAAVDGIKAAGKAGMAAGAQGVAGLKPALGRGASAASSVGGRMFSRLSTGLGAALAGLRRVLAKGLGPVFAVISPPRLRGPLAVLGTISLLAGLARVPSSGFDAQTQTATGIGIAALALACLPWLLSEGRLSLGWAAPFAKPFSGLRRRLPGLPRWSPALRGWLMIAGLVGTIGGGSWLFARSGTSIGTPSVLASLPLVAAKPIEGRAAGLSGDAIRVGEMLVRLAGIEAPERDQKCKGRGAKGWPCGAAAADALGKLVRGKTAVCEVSGKDDQGRPLGVCRVDGKDVADELVRGGHVFAASGLFSRYGSAESEARAAGLGVWRGDGERPGEWRAKRWDQAKRASPDGCPIKGHVSAEGRIYVLPWSADYERVKVRANKGERWFCSEQDARAAGWRASESG